jgi:hypothetical protein
MAKSLRSKWKRKMRAVKRERYGEKELAQLNKMLIAAGELPPDKNGTLIVDKREHVRAARTWYLIEIDKRHELYLRS